MNAAAGIKRQRSLPFNNNGNVGNNNNNNNNSNNESEKNVAEVNIPGLIEQVRSLAVGNESSPGYRLSPSLENLPVRALNSPRGSPSIPYRNLFPKPLRRFGSLPLAAMGASPPSTKKQKPAGSEGNLKRRRSRRARRGGRRNRTSRH